MISDSVLTTQDIQKLLPHRYPFLLVDRITQLQGDESAIGIKNVTINEPFFVGHFPGNPIMPGVLIIEAMAQTSGALVVHALQSPSTQNIVYFMSVEEARFRKPVTPGDTMHIHVKKLKHRSNVWRYQGTVYVGDHLAAEAAYTAMVV